MSSSEQGVIRTESHSNIDNEKKKNSAKDANQMSSRFKNVKE